MNDSPGHFFLIAGEPSGDILGARLMAAMRGKTDGDIAFSGIGGPRMIAQGLTPLFPMSELSMMGLAEVLPRIPYLLARIRQAASEIKRLRPAALVTIDAPDFSFRVAARVHAAGVPCIHYVAPSVWAWRPGRAARISHFLDHLLAVLPFEPPYFEAEGLPCSFVGHPAVEGGAGKGDGMAFRARHNIPPDRKIIVMLPGSRQGEVNRLLPIFVDALKRVQSNRPGMTVIVPVAPEMTAQVRGALAQSGFDSLVIEGDVEKFDGFAAAEVALAKSGTVTLELALAGVPAVIAYRINPITHAIVSRIVRGRFAGLPNVILGRELMPELLQDQCRPDRLAGELIRLLDDSKARNAQIAGAAEVRGLVSVPDMTPSEAAADIVLRVAREKAAIRDP